MVGSSYSQWGSGISQGMKSSIISIINQGQLYYGSDYEKHATYISTELSKLDSGTWNVILIPNMKLKGPSDIGYRGFYGSLCVLEQKYAILFEECIYTTKLSHIIVKREALTRTYVSSENSDSNMGIGAERCDQYSESCRFHYNNLNQYVFECKRKALSLEQEAMELCSYGLLLQLRIP